MFNQEYVKLNTSIQTGSNANHLIYDEDGNIEANIELRLPDNMFVSTPQQKVEKVTMQTSKFRLSMENTPLAQIPVDAELSASTNKVVSTCKLDVYPFCLLKDNTIQPGVTELDKTPFPSYKNHKVRYNIRYFFSMESEPITLETEEVTANTLGYSYPETSLYYNIVKGCGALNISNHMLNLCASGNHERLVVEENMLLVKNIATLQQMLQEALENAITFASTEDFIDINVDLIDESIITDETTPKPNKDLEVTIPDSPEKTACFWKYEKTDSPDNKNICSLKSACKPIVSLDEQSLTISYDSVAFNDCIPVIWNTAYVNTYEKPQQMTMDEFRNSVWTEPPPKRMYKYNVNTTETDYNYYLYEYANCACMNIIANQVMKDTFSFLPWIKVDVSNVDDIKIQKKFHVEIYNLIREGGVDNIWPYFLCDSTNPEENGKNCQLRNRHYTGHSRTSGLTDAQAGKVFEVWGEDRSVISYLFKKPHTADLYDYSARYDQQIGPGANLTWGDNYVWTEGFNIEPLDQNYIIPTTDTQILREYDSYDTKLQPGDTVINEDFHEDTNNIFSAIPDDQYGIAFKTCYCVMDISQPISSRVRKWYPSVPIQGGWITPNTEFQLIPSAPMEGIVYFHTAVDDNDYDEIWGFWSIAKSEELPQTPGMDEWCQVSSVQKYAFSEKQRIRNVQTLTHENITETTGDKKLKKELIPNLLDTSEVFYILDGTTAKVNIGEQEVVKYNGKVKITDEIVITKSTNNTIQQKWRSGEYTNQKDIPYIFANDVLNYTGIYFSVPNTITFKNALVYMRIFDGDPDDPETPSTIVDSYVEKGDQINEGLLYLYMSPVLLSDDSEGTYVNDENQPAPETNVTYTDDTTLTPGTTSTTTTTFSGKEIINANQIGNGDLYQIYANGAWVNTRSVQVTHDADYDVYSRVPDTTPAYVHHTRAGPSSTAYYIIATVWDITPGEATGYVNNGAGEKVPRTIVSNWLRTDDFRYLYTFEEHKSEEVKTETISFDELSTYYGNVKLSFTWNNLPVVVLSPISSIVLTLNGIQVTQEMQPINITQPTGSSLTSTIPLIENFFSTASTLRDLHDELIVAKETFDDTARCTLARTSGYERTLQIAAKYITKDGKLHQIYIPPNGVFIVQITFGVSFYSS